MAGVWIDHGQALVLGTLDRDELAGGHVANETVAVAPPGDPLALAARLHATLVFDYLRRLRIRPNYGDVSAFLMVGVEDRSHEPG